MFFSRNYANFATKFNVMTTKTDRKSLFTKIHFIGSFWAVAAVLFVFKCAFPELAGKHLSEVKEYVEQHTTKHRVVMDSIEYNRRQVDSSFMAQRRPLRILSPEAQQSARSRVVDLRYRDAFPDLNDVQLATASRLGEPECEDREEAAQNIDHYVFIGESPYYDVEKMTHSVPYLVPRAALLVEEIGRNFFDSLAVRGIPFHKMVVTSALRTNEDVQRLRRRNANASDQSCHRFGTTIDISYNIFHRVQDPDLPPQTETYSGTLKAILGHVLNDLRQQKACYVKYEVHQSCFHITCR